MKRVLPILVAAIAAAIAIVKLREETPLPQQPEGSWELADDKPS